MVQHVPWSGGGSGMTAHVPWSTDGGQSCPGDNGGGSGCGICVPGRYGNLPTPGPNTSTCPGSTNIPLPGLPGCPGFS